MQKTKIEWCDYSWNPITGCLNDCFYCYAKKIAMRFDGHFKPTFHEDRLEDPFKVVKSQKIFVCSMADLFGDWVPKDWIDRVLRVIKANNNHIFQLLTKNPKRYLEFEFPDNVWLGITEDYINQARLNYLKEAKAKYKFISFEPLLSDMSGLDLSGIDLVIIGAMTGAGAIKPEKQWIDSIYHPNIIYKNNIKKYL